MKRLIYFTADDHSVYAWSRGRLTVEAKFPGDDLGVTAFREYLSGHRGALFYAVADLAGEDFHEELIPYLRGGDRELVVQRRLAQRYRDTRLAAALSLGHVRGERRNERLLLTSFTNTQRLTPWLDALAESEAKLAGMFSAPLPPPPRAGARAPDAAPWSPPTAPACASAMSTRAGCASRAWSARPTWCPKRWPPSCARRPGASPRNCRC